MITQAAVLCGGRGSRLGHLTADTPKPLLPVGGAPFLDAVLYRLADVGIRRILLLAGFAGEKIVEYARSSPLRPEVIVEPRPLGTGGAIGAAADRLDPEFIVANGDTLLDLDPTALSVPMEHPSVGAVLALLPVDDAMGCGVATLHPSGRVARFVPRQPCRGAGLAYVGVCAVRRSEVLRLRAGDSMEALLSDIAAAGRAAAVVGPRGAAFIDMGTPDGLARADEYVTRRI